MKRFHKDENANNSEINRLAVNEVSTIEQSEQQK